MHFAESYPNSAYPTVPRKDGEEQDRHRGELALSAFLLELV